MTPFIPHSAQLRRSLLEYIDEIEDWVGECISESRDSTALAAIYKATLAADAVLAKLPATAVPKLRTHRSVLRRIPLAVATGQLPSAWYELRRGVELTFWSVYFNGHPVEWSHFSRQPSLGFASRMEHPIEFCAHREITFYCNYAKELMQQEPSGFAVKAANGLAAKLSMLNAEIHPGHESLTSSLVPKAAIGAGHGIERFRKAHREVTSWICILLGAYFRKSFDRLPPMYRGWFDWLVGAEIAKEIQSGPFGLPY